MIAPWIASRWLTFFSAMLRAHRLSECTSLLFAFVWPSIGLSVTLVPDDLIFSALEDAVLPLSQPVRATDGTLLHEVAVPRGTNIFVSVLGCNRNEALWGSDAGEWKPERWLAPLPAALESAAIPGVYSNL